MCDSYLQVCLETIFHLRVVGTFPGYVYHQISQSTGWLIYCSLLEMKKKLRKTSLPVDAEKPGNMLSENFFGFLVSFTIYYSNVTYCWLTPFVRTS